MSDMHAHSELNSPLDELYLVNPHIVSSIKSADSVTVRGVGSPFELPLAFFQVLMAFAEARTAREAFHVLDVDVPIEEFERIIDDLFDRGLLRREQPIHREVDLRRVLAGGMFSDAALIERISVWMRRGRAIIIPDAMPSDLAEQAYQDLSKSANWVVAEGHHDFFHFRYSAIPQLEGQTTTLTECNRLFRSHDTRRFIGDLSGEDCAGEANVAAAWYRPNEYALPHDDMGANNPRSVAYIWYLTKDWQREWGGALFWCPTGQYICPRFNMLVMFKVMPSNMHFVCPVALTATARRLTINGFWNRSQQSARLAPVDPEALISPQAYGPCAQEVDARGSIVVL